MEGVWNSCVNRSPGHIRMHVQILITFQNIYWDLWKVLAHLILWTRFIPGSLWPWWQFHATLYLWFCSSESMQLLLGRGFVTQGEVKWAKGCNRIAKLQQGWNFLLLLPSDAGVSQWVLQRVMGGLWAMGLGPFMTNKCPCLNSKVCPISVQLQCCQAVDKKIDIT